MRTPKIVKLVIKGGPMTAWYPHARWFEVIKYKVAILTRKFIGLSFILAVGALLGSYWVGGLHTYVAPAQAEDKSGELLASKIESLKDEVVATLSKCESGGYSEEDGIIIFDSNSKASIGQLQWQVASVIHYYKVLYNKTITRKEAVLIALDKEKASSLAKDVGFKTKNKFGKDWYNCSTKHGLDAQVDLIKKLEK